MKTLETNLMKGMVSLRLKLVKARESDLSVLTQMNKGLIDDEGSSNPMTIPELEERMKGWMQSDWEIDLICKDSVVIGYALYQYRWNQYIQDEKDVYLRQYYIKPAFRRQGIGKEGIKLLNEKRFRDVTTINIDVLSCNQRGIEFWKNVGFIPYSLTMKKSK